MDVKDCMKFATKNPICYPATVDGDQPRVRALLLYPGRIPSFWTKVLFNTLTWP